MTWSDKAREASTKAKEHYAKTASARAAAKAASLGQGQANVPPPRVGEKTLHQSAGGVVKKRLL